MNIITSSLFVHGSTLTYDLISEQPHRKEMGFGSCKLHHCNVFAHNIITIVIEDMSYHIYRRLFQTVMYLAEIGHKVLNKCPTMRQ